MTCSTFLKRHSVTHEGGVSREKLFIALVVSGAHPEFKNDSYVNDNLAVLHIYFDKLHFMTYERKELYDIIDFTAYLGGLLGMCMGFSLLSAIEVVYFFTARLYYNYVTPRNEDV